MKVPSLKFLIVIFLFLNACGFKVVKQADLVNFRILEIKGEGDKRINFKIKNKLISSASQDERKLVNISLITKTMTTRTWTRLREFRMINELTTKNLSAMGSRKEPNTVTIPLLLAMNPILISPTITSFIGMVLISP